MEINRKQLLRYTGATAAGALLGGLARGLSVPGAGDSGSPPIPGAAIPARPPGATPPPEPATVGNESFSQCGEDMIVAFMIYYLGLGARVTYLDVGASDPVRFSNTYYFYRKGHRGVLVEPNVALCKRLREKRPMDTTLEAGIGVTAAKEADYYIMTYDGLNTFSKEEAEHQARSSQGRVSIQQVIKMPLLDINDVMHQHFVGEAPTFLSVDTEGLDLAILKSIDYDRYRPPIICAETLVSNTRAIRAEIPEFMATRGYVVRGGSFVNTIFVDSKRL